MYQTIQFKSAERRTSATAGVDGAQMGRESITMLTQLERALWRVRVWARWLMIAVEAAENPMLAASGKGGAL